MATDRPGRPFKVFSDKLRPNKRPERGTTESRVSLIRLRTRTRDAREISYFPHCVFPILLTTVPLPLLLVPLRSVSFSLFLWATYSQLQQPRYPIVLPTFVRSLDILSRSIYGQLATGRAYFAWNSRIDRDDPILSRASADNIARARGIDGYLSANLR